MTQLLDEHLGPLEWFALDVNTRHTEKIGRKGLNIEPVLRCVRQEQLDFGRGDRIRQPRGPRPVSSHAGAENLPLWKGVYLEKMPEAWM